MPPTPLAPDPGAPGRRSFLRTALGALAGAPILGALGCDTTGPTGTGTDGGGGGGGNGGGVPGSRCDIDERDILQGAARDGIPALSNPPTTAVGGSNLDYLQGQDRVIGVWLGDHAVAVPLNILWWHEVVNLDLAGRRVAVTHCPLTGSSVSFDREPLGGAELGVSGLLYLNNLIMYDRVEDDSLWPQMLRRAGCGPRTGVDLPTIPAWETTWDGWAALHPETQVVTSETGFTRSYRVYPYTGYDRPDEGSLLFPLRGGVDVRRPPKERVLGIPDTTGGTAFPFGRLAELGPIAVVPSGPHVVFWNEGIAGATAYRRSLDGSLLSFTVSGSAILDRETGSSWRFDGLAISGPLAGRRLDATPGAYVAYWFAWVAFHRATFLWGSE